MAWLYLKPELEDSAAVVGGRVALGGDEGKHAVTVARTRVGERLSIGDGDGLIVEGSVVSVGPGELVLEIDAVRSEPRPRPELWLAQALAKGDRDELAVKAATELGVSGVIPWAAERSVTRWEGAKIEKGRARWAAIVREASKQAIRSRVPAVVAPLTTPQLATEPGLLLVLDPTAATPLSEVDAAAAEAERVTLVVGPEGGISPRELERLEAAGAVRVRLGTEILRTSTAGPAALAVLNARLGRW